MVGLLAAALVALAEGRVSAHIGIDPGKAPRGEEVKTLHFQVPNESDTASTVKLELQLPQSPRFTFVRAQPTPGWAGSTQKVNTTITAVIWEGGEIKPGEFQEFGVRVGPLPKKGKQVVFKALQTYSNGDVSRWIEESVKGTPEPEYPAPVLKLVAGKSSGH